MGCARTKRRALGGALLAFVTVAKLYPGLLVLYLLFRRDWRGVMWTAAFAVAFVALTIVDVGWQPFAAFRDHFSGLLSGEAFPAFRNPSAMAANLSIPGIVFKLTLLGFGDMGFGAARVVGTVYMVVAIAATGILALRAPRDGAGPIIWLTVLLLATLRSPFLPWTYGTFPALWLLTLLVAAHVPREWEANGAIKPIAIYHEHPDWFRPLFAELDRRGMPYVRLDAAAHTLRSVGDRRSRTRSCSTARARRRTCAATARRRSTRWTGFATSSASACRW